MYLMMKNDAPAEVNIKQWFKLDVDTAFTTANRYMSFALLVKFAPRVLVCGLDFSVIMDHYRGICNYIMQDSEFARQLKSTLRLIVHGRRLTIKADDSVELPDFKMNISANTEFYEEIEACNHVGVDVDCNVDEDVDGGAKSGNADDANGDADDDAEIGVDGNENGNVARNEDSVKKAE
jgi:hypothetical protein